MPIYLTVTLIAIPFIVLIAFVYVNVQDYLKACDELKILQEEQEQKLDLSRERKEIDLTKWIY